MKQTLLLALILSITTNLLAQTWGSNNDGLFTTEKVSIGGSTSGAGYSLQIWQQSDDRLGGIRIRNNTNSQSSFFWMDANDILRLDNSSGASRDIAFNGDGSGNIGFGVSNPNHRVDIHGTIGLREFKDSYTNGDVRIFNHSGSTQGFMIRPWHNGSWDWQKDFGYQADISTWYVENGFNVKTGELNVSESLVVGSNMGSSPVTDNMTFPTKEGLIVGNAGSVLDANNNGLNVVSRTNLRFYVNEYTGNSNQAMTISTNGNVGIGTTSPDQELTVDGTIHAEEVLVDLNVPGPDYVFEEDYPLQDLSSLEQYLKTNKHLPEVPSASEMETDGIKVGEMEMLLLKKVEELTLHLIELKKENSELKAFNTEVLNRLEKLENK